MEIIKGGSNVAAQFEAAGIEIAKPAAPAAETKEEAPKAAEAAPPAPTAPVSPPVDDEEEDEHGLTAAQRAQFTQSMQKQIGKKHRQYKEADERAIKYHAEALAEKQAREAAERRLAELEGKQQPAKPAAAPVDEDPKPVWKEGMNTEEYWDDRDAWVRRQAVRDFQAAETKRQAEEAREAQGKAAEALITKATELVPDFAEVTSKANLNFGDDVAEAIWQSDRFPEIAYHLAKNPDVAAGIRKMTIGKALLAIGKLEATLPAFAPANGSGAAKEPPKPSTPETESSKPAASPSKRPASVITPIPTGIGTQAESAPSTTKEHAVAYGKREGVDLYRRRRH